LTRVAVFVDYQNAYMGAREAFGYPTDPATVGQVYPRRLGVLLTDRGRQVDPERDLEYVAVFRGEPSSRYSPKGQAACDRQVRFWRAQAAVRVTTRPLKYYPYLDDHGVERWAPREKGIDVLISLAMVVGAINDEYDVAVLMSCDTDLLPAIEQVRSLTGKRCEVASWRSRKALQVPRAPIWCHRLERSDYDMLEDTTDYTLPQSAPPSANP
jgi:hypothetical protein